MLITKIVIKIDLGLKKVWVLDPSDLKKVWVDSYLIYSLHSNSSKSINNGNHHHNNSGIILQQQKRQH